MRVLPVLVFVAVCSSCFALEDADYIPYSEGAEWVFEAKITVPSSAVITETARLKIGAPEQYNGKTYYRRMTSSEGTKPWSITKLVRKDQTGLYSIDPSQPGAKEQPELLFPLKIGQKWNRMMGPWNVTDTILGIESITVSGKAYDNCLHIRTTSTDGSYTEDHWEAPKVGSIKSEIVYGNGARVSLTLREFKPGKAK